jgi:hypothetical protein
VTGAFAVTRNILIVVVAVAEFAHAADVSALPSTIDVEGFTDGKTTVTITKQLDIHSTKNITGLVLDATDLLGPNGIDIDASNIKFAATQINLTKDYTIPVAISIGGLTKPGKYTGSFTLRAPDSQTGAQLPLTVELIGKPVVTLGSDGLTSFSCLIPLSCSLAAKWMGVRQAITIDNSKGAGDAAMQPPSIVLRASRGDRVLCKTDLNPILPHPNPLPRGRSVLQLTVPTNLPADRYQGVIVLPVANSDDPVTASVTLDVKHGPWVALLVLLFGILVGRQLQSMNTPQAQAQQRLLSALSGLQAAESGVTDPGFQAVIDRLIGAAHEAIRVMLQTETDISQDLVTLSAAIDLAKNLERLTAATAGLDPAVQADAEQHLHNARTAFLGEDFQTADDERNKAQQAILAAVAPQTVTGAKTAFRRSEFQFAAPTTTPVTRAPRPVHLRLLQGFAGTEPAGAEDRFAYLKPFLFSLLLIGLLLLGLYTLYVKNADFGADLVFDYFSLLTWGLSADVAQRTLQNLQLPK